MMRLTPALLAAALLLGPLPARADLLVTTEEAARPAPAAPARGPALVTRSGITRAPGIERLAPNGDGPLASPVALTIRFVPHGGARIDTDSVRLTYLKSPEIDLTGRIRPFLTPEGIDMKQADLPPGEHTLRLDLRDSEGRLATTTFVVSVRR